MQEEEVGVCHLDLNELCLDVVVRSTKIRSFNNVPRPSGLQRSYSASPCVDGEKRESFQYANIGDCIGMLVDVDKEDSTT